MSELKKEEIVLNEDQENALVFLKNFVKKGTNFYCLLEGSAGSGKTTTIDFFTRWLKKESFIANIAYSSPTHKALKVMRKMNTVSGVKFFTLHALLGLKHKITPDGREVYERDKFDPSKLNEFDFVIVDEASMISDELFHELNDQNYRGIKVLFIGDRNQINPVNHIHSIPMLEDKRELYDISHVSLTKIVRQAEHNPIIQLSQSILKNEFKLIKGQDSINDGIGVEMIDSKNGKRIEELLKEYFVCDEFDNNADYCRVIAWRNKSVDYFNNVIRKFKYGKNCQKIVIGEKLVAGKPLKEIKISVDEEEESDVIFNTNEDLVVKYIDESFKTLYGKVYHFYDTFVQGDTDCNTIHILHEKSEKLYADTLKEMANAAKNEKDNFARSKKWKAYYSFINCFADVKWAYAITAHNSQGSTYDNALVFYTDIDINWREDEKQRILYTSVTRPRNKLYIF